MRIAFLSTLITLICSSLLGQAGNRAPIAASDMAADSAIVRAPSPATPGSIMFANAFRWNHAGPTGGFWSENDVNDYVFRPVYSNISAYNLIVYNRNGYQVFESKDLHKGWDGYLRDGSLAPQGVYIWKASGKYNDGTPFSKAGDVTFIY